MYTKNTLGFTVLMALYDEQGATGTDHMLPWTPACKREGPLPGNLSDMPANWICEWGKH